MSQESSEPRDFKGPHRELLRKFSEFMEKLWREHRTSPTKAGSQEFYSWGNVDYTVVMSAHKFDDLVEVITRDGRLDIKKDSDGKIDCSPKLEFVELHRRPDQVRKTPPLEPGEILQRTITALNHYYYSGKRI